MRTLRHSLRFGMMMAAAAGVSFASAQAHADTAGGASGSPNSSTGSGALHFDYNQGLDTSLGTDYIGPSVAKFRVIMKLDPVKDGGPLYSIDMPKGAIVEASWSGDKKIVLKAVNGSQSDGTIKVRHTLTPSLDLRISYLGNTADFSFSGTKLLSKIPGAKFSYDSQATKEFAPWGFTTVETNLNAPDLANSVLFSMPFSSFPELLPPDKWEGTFGLRASTKPSFKYKTTKVTIPGTNAPLTSNAGEAILDAVDGDFMEVMAQVEGEMNVAGTLALQPFIAMTKAFGSNFTATIAIDAFSIPYTVPTSKVAYQAMLVHIPLPNVHVPTKGIDLGDVKPGGIAKKTVTIENSGEMPATMTFKTTDPQFAVPNGSVTVPPKGKFELLLKFSSNNSGPAIADITVASNDPDSPEQVFQIGANGAEVRDTGRNGDALPGAPPSVDSGCGCKTAGTTTSTGGWAGIGLLALGLTVAARRRRTAA